MLAAYRAERLAAYSAKGSVILKVGAALSDLYVLAGKTCIKGEPNRRPTLGYEWDIDRTKAAVCSNSHWKVVSRRRETNRLSDTLGSGDNVGTKSINKTVLAALLAFAIICGWPLFSARAQEASQPGQAATGPIVVRGKPLPPGSVYGPVRNHPELNTPEHRKEEAEEVKEYCRTHKCVSGGMRSYAPGAEESIDRARRAFALRHPGFANGVGDPSHTIVCYTDPAHPNGPDLCYRASDGSRVTPGTPGPQ